MENFNPAMHQPQPPGYPFFVALCRLLHLAVPRVEWVLLLAGIIGLTLGTLLVAKAGRDLFGTAAGVFAAVLFFFDPACWVNGMTNQVRSFLAVAGAGAAIFAVRALRQPQPAAFAALCFWVGTLAGFRPATLAFAIPLLAYVAWKRRSKGRELMLGAAALALPVSLWLGVLVYICGGPIAYINILRGYASEQFSGTSLLFGAAAPSAWRMAKSAFVFHSIGAIAWSWALLVLLAQRRFPRSWSGGGVLLAWFIPAYLFESFVHVADADQVLFTLPAVSLLGGRMIAEAAGSRRRNHVLAGVAAALISGTLFFHPFRGIAEAASYKMVRYVDSETRATIDTLQRLRASGPVRIVAYDSMVTWRQLSFYFPTDSILVVDSAPHGATARYVRKTQSDPLPAGVIRIPSGRLAFVLPPPGRGWREALRKQASASADGPLMVVDATPGMQLHIGQADLVIQQ